jgi:ribonucleoside-diphosphate reductase alpha chain
MKPDSTVVFSFPVKSPAKALTTAEVGTIEQLELAKTYGEHWAEHTVSLTAYYTDDTWYDACSWIWKNWDSMIGMSFLPHDGGSYKQAPYQEIDADTYKGLTKEMPNINWDELASFETEDTTQGAKEAACVGGACEI